MKIIISQKNLLRSLTLTTSLILTSVAQATFSKPVIDDNDQEYQIYAEHFSQNVEETCLENQIENLKLFFRNFEQYDHQYYIFSKNLYDLKKRDQYNVKNEDISSIKTEILQSCTLNSLEKNLVNAVLTKSAINTWYETLNECYECKDLENLLNRMVYTRNKLLKTRLKFILNELPHRDKKNQTISIFLTYPDQKLRAYDKFLRDRLVNVFSFVNQFIKKIYLTLPENSKIFCDSAYLFNNKILNNFIKSDSWHHCTPDESYRDILGQELKLSLKNMNRSQQRVMIRKVNAALSKNSDKDSNENLKNLLNSHALDACTQPKTKSKPQKKKKAATQAKASEKNDEGFISESTPKDTPVVVKEKIKTKGIPNLDLKKEVASQEEKNVSLEATIVSPIKYIRKKRHTIFENFWTTKSGFTYEEFTKMFGKLGGYVDENTGSSHMRLIYKDQNGFEHTGGIWKMHGGITEFNEDSTSLLKLYLRKCGLTLDSILPIKFDDKISA